MFSERPQFNLTDVEKPAYFYGLQWLLHVQREIAKACARGKKEGKKQDIWGKADPDVDAYICDILSIT